MNDIYGKSELIICVINSLYHKLKKETRKGNFFLNLKSYSAITGITHQDYVSF